MFKGFIHKTADKKLKQLEISQKKCNKLHFIYSFENGFVS